MATKKTKTEVEVVEVQAVPVPDLHAYFAGCALSGLIARGAGQSADAICSAAINYADAMMERYK